MPKQKSKVDPKMQARLDAKVRPDEPVKEDRIYINMKPKKKAPAKKTTKKKSKSTVNKAGNYTKPTMRKRLFERIKAGSKGGKPGQWSARKAQLLAKEYKSKGGGYK